MSENVITISISTINNVTVYEVATPALMNWLGARYISSPIKLIEDNNPRWVGSIAKLVNLMRRLKVKYVLVCEEPMKKTYFTNDVATLLNSIQCIKYRAYMLKKNSLVKIAEKV